MDFPGKKNCFSFFLDLTSVFGPNEHFPIDWAMFFSLKWPSILSPEIRYFNIFSV